MSNIMAAYNPDVLSCLANLSNDEVFTPPEIANKMLDMLPQDLFKSPDTKFLDPACKSGVFLREIAKRLLEGLMPGYTDWLERIDDKKRENEELDDEEKEFLEQLQATVDHIFKEQLYGIAITELTSLLSRRSLYCSKYPNSDYSVTKFDNPSGNIRFINKQHRFKDGKCVFCGASAGQYDRDEGLETYAYEFIHTVKPEEILNMKFDVIIGNPPYQLSDGGNAASAKPIYQLFVAQAKKLNPRFLSMIIPSRWMTGGKGLDEFRSEMIHDKQIVLLHDYLDASDCFSGVEIKGGVCYFLWEKGANRACSIYTHNAEGVLESTRLLAEEGEDIFIRDHRLIDIKNKVNICNEKSFSTIVSAAKQYGLRNDFFKDTYKYKLPAVSSKPIPEGYSILGLENLKRVYKYIPKDYPLPKKEGLDKYKVFISESYGSGQMGDTPPNPVVASPGECCTETFLQVGPFNTKKEAENCVTYIQTKLFRLLVGMRKMTQHATQSVYAYVPLVDFTETWTDEELYEKYNLTQEEIDFIESMIKPMDLGGDDNG